MPTKNEYRDAARSIWGQDGQLEIDDDAPVSKGEDDGAYVQAWVWVSDDEVAAELRR